MATTKQKRLEQKRAAILSTAEEILIRRGKNATMGDIAQALDMDKSSLYYYFKGIPEILNAILDREYYDFSLNIHEIRRENKAHVDVLKEMVRVILEFYHDNIEILLIILTRISPLFLEPGNREKLRNTYQAPDLPTALERHLAATAALLNAGKDDFPSYEADRAFLDPVSAALAPLAFACLLLVRIASPLGWGLAHRRGE